MKKLIYLILLLPIISQAEVYLTADNGTTSYFTPCFPLWDTTGVSPVTGITSATSGFEVLLIADNQNAVTEFAGAADLETIGTIGQYNSPTTATDIRFGECDAVDLQGFYQIQFHNDHMAISGATELVVRLHDAGNSIADQVLFIRQNPLTGADVQTQSSSALNNYFTITSGTAESGTTSNLTDTSNLTQAEDAWNKNYLLIVEFSSQTEARCIVDFNATTDTLRVYPAFNTDINTEDYRIVLEPGCP